MNLCLNDDCLYQIFNWFNVQQLLTYSLTCKQFYQVVGNIVTSNSVQKAQSMIHHALVHSIHALWQYLILPWNENASKHCCVLQNSSTNETAK